VLNAGSNASRRSGRNGTAPSPGPGPGGSPPDRRVTAEVAGQFFF